MQRMVYVMAKTHHEEEAKDNADAQKPNGIRQGNKLSNSPRF
jgi:hypothetical protein